jgi:hypothetical protein
MSSNLPNFYFGSRAWFALKKYCINSGGFQHQTFRGQLFKEFIPPSLAGQYNGNEARTFQMQLSPMIPCGPGARCL